MNKNVCTFDTKEFDEILEKLNQETRNKILVSSLKAGGEILQSNTVNKLRQKVGSKASSMEHGVKLGVDKDYLTVWVSILKDYRLKWFESGTTERYRKVRGIDDKGRKYVKKGEKAGYTGRMTDTKFFTDARESSINDIEQAIITEFEAQMNALFGA